MARYFSFFLLSMLLVACQTIDRQPASLIQDNLAPSSSSASVFFRSLMPSSDALTSKVGVLEEREKAQLYLSDPLNTEDFIDRYSFELSKSFKPIPGPNPFEYIDLISISVSILAFENYEPYLASFLLPSEPLSGIEAEFNFLNELDNASERYKINCKPLKGNPESYVQSEISHEFDFCLISILFQKFQYTIFVYIHEDYITTVEADQFIVELIRLQQMCEDCLEYNVGQFSVP